MEDILIPIFGLVGVFGMPVFIVWIVFYFDKRNKEQFHSTLQKLIESGQESTLNYAHHPKKHSFPMPVLEGMPSFRLKYLSTPRVQLRC